MSKEKIRELEEEMSKTKYNKATQKHFSTLKARIAKLKEKESSSSKSGGYGYAPKKQGDATVVIIGPPSVGKSTLINAITNAQSKTGAYDFTTLDVIPGTLEINGAKIQVLDIPGIIEGASEGKGLGKRVLAVARIADLLLIMCDINTVGMVDVIKKELHEAGFRLDEEKPNISFTKKSRGGFNLECPPDIPKPLVIDILQQFRIFSADMVIQSGTTIDQLIDFLSGHKDYVPSLVVINKSDLSKKRAIENAIYISAIENRGLDQLKTAIWKKLGMARIYMKKPGNDPDMKQPLIMRHPCTITDVFKKIRIPGQLRYARVWGSSRFGGQKLKGSYKLKDEDIVELHL